MIDENLNEKFRVNEFRTLMFETTNNIDKIVKWLRIVRLLEALEETQSDSKNLKLFEAARSGFENLKLFEISSEQLKV